MSTHLERRVADATFPGAGHQGPKYSSTLLRTESYDVGGASVAWASALYDLTPPRCVRTPLTGGRQPRFDRPTEASQLRR